MAYVQQICDGYNKKSLMGNWYEERLYPEQAFRDKQEKKVHEEICRPAKKMKELLALMGLASNGPCLVYREEANGRQPVGLSSTMGW